jgi:hypothetical protein
MTKDPYLAMGSLSGRPATSNSTAAVQAYPRSIMSLVSDIVHQQILFALMRKRCDLDDDFVDFVTSDGHVRIPQSQLRGEG